MGVSGGLPRFCQAGQPVRSKPRREPRSQSDRRTVAGPAVGRKDAMRRTLPEKIVAVVEALAEDRADWCVVGRDQTLAAHAEAVLERVRTVLPLLLRAVVEQATSGLDVRLAHARVACPGCGEKVEPPGRPRRRQVATQCGTVTLERPW